MIRAEALRLGFDSCGMSRATCLAGDARYLRSWLRNGYQGNMAYMEKNEEKRVDPAKLVEGAQSVVSVVMNYVPAYALYRSRNHKERNCRGAPAGAP